MAFPAAPAQALSGTGCLIRLTGKLLAEMNGVFGSERKIGLDELPAIQSGLFDTLGTVLHRSSDYMYKLMRNYAAEGAANKLIRGSEPPSRKRILNRAGDSVAVDFAKRQNLMVGNPCKCVGARVLSSPGQRVEFAGAAEDHDRDLCIVALRVFPLELPAGTQPGGFQYGRNLPFHLFDNGARPRAFEVEQDRQIGR